MTINFKKSALAVAVASAMVLPMAANAANLGLQTPASHPTLKGDAFMGALGSELALFVDVQADATADLTLHVVYFNGATQLNDRTSTIALANATAAGDINQAIIAASSAQAGGTYDGVKIVLAAGAGDDVDGANSFFGITVDGAGVLQGAANATLAGALGAGNNIPVDSTYNGIKVTSAVADDINAPTKIWVTTNADSWNSNAGAAPAAADNALELFDITKGATVVAQAQVQSAVAGNANTLEIRQTQGAANNFNPADVNTVATPTSNANKYLSDGTSNVVIASSLTITALAAPVYATTGQVGVGTSTEWAANTSGPVVNMRMDAPLKDVVSDGNDVEVKADATTLASGTALVADANGDTTIVQVTLPNVAGTERYRTNPDDGLLQYTDDNGVDPIVWANVTVRILQAAANPITHLFDAAIKVSSSLTPTEVNAGVAPAQESETHGTNGLLDGATVDFGTDVTVGGTGGYHLAVSGTTAAGDDSKTDAKDGVIALDSATGDAADNDIVSVLFDSAKAGDYDWDKNGIIESKDQDEYDKFGTGVDSLGKVTVNLKASASQTTYDLVYDPQTGANMKATLGYTNVIQDGIDPTLMTAVLEAIEGSDLTNLALGFSEPVISVAGTNTAEVVALNGVPINLGNINAGVETLGDAEINVSAKDDTILNVEGVAGAEVGQTVFIVTSPTPTDGDAAGNPLSAPTGESAVKTTLGETLYLNPKMVNAFAVQSAVTGETAKVVVQYDKAVAKGSKATSLDGIFEVTIEPAVGDDVTLSIPEADITGLGGTQLELKLPTGVVNGNIDGMEVEYNAAGDNKLVSTDTDPVDACDTGAAGCDEQDVDYSANTKGLYSMEIEGSIVNGAEGVPDGTLLRVDLIAEGVIIMGGTATVPCAACGKTTIVIGGFGSLADQIAKARRLGEKSVETKLFFDGAIAGHGWEADFFDNGGTEYAVKVDAKSGKISGDASGSLTLVDGGMAVWDTTVALFDGAGPNFRLNVGANTRPTDGFVTAAVQVPGVDGWQQILPADPNLLGYTPFVDHLDTKGTIVDTGPIDLTSYEAVPVRNMFGWQTFGPQEEIAYAAKAKQELMPERLFFTYDEDGDPSNGWLDGDQDDMAFLLTGNKVEAAYEFNDMTSGMIKGLDGTRGVAFTEGDTAGDVNWDMIGAGPNDAVADKDNNYTIWLPVTGEEPSRAVKSGWDLFTAAGELSVPVKDLGFGAVICTGNGDQALSWFDGADANSLTEMDPGDTCFGYAEKEIKDFDGK